MAANCAGDLELTAFAHRMHKVWYASFSSIDPSIAPDPRLLRSMTSLCLRSGELRPVDIGNL
eukprot:12278333-Alexandrium_andersonii.AAC.1